MDVYVYVILAVVQNLQRPSRVMSVYQRKTAQTVHFSDYCACAFNFSDSEKEFLLFVLFENIRLC
jgi:hypothetical protein